MRWLIIEPGLSRHRLEYYNHIYKKAIIQKDDSFVFVVDSDFPSVKDRFEWPESKNVEFYILNEKEHKLAEAKNIIFLVLFRAILLWKMIKKFKPNRIFLLEVIFYLPFVPLYMSIFFRKIKISGIIFLVYTYRWKRQNFIRKILDVMKFWMMAKSPCFDNIKIINDSSAVAYLNKLYDTDKFCYLPDPIVPINIKEEINIREHFVIPDDKILLCQFGGLGYSKGTDECLKAFLMLPLEIRQKFVCVLAGRIGGKERTEIYRLIGDIGNSMQLIVIDEFCSYDFIGSLCKASDYVLLTYRKNEGSSGVLGISAQFHTPVISTNKNLVGKLIKKYRLGIALDDVSAKGIASCLVDKLSNRQYGFESYISNNSVSNFIDKLF